MQRYIERVVDLLDPSLNVLHGLTLDEARERVGSGDKDACLAVHAAFSEAAVPATISSRKGLGRRWRRSRSASW